MTSHLIYHKTIVRTIGLLAIVVCASSLYACPPPPQCDPPDRYVMWAIKGSTIECKSEESTNLFLDYYSAPHTVKFAMVAQIYLNGQWSVWAEWADYSSMDSPGCGSCDAKQCSFTPSGGMEVTRSYTTISMSYSQQPLAGSVSGTHNGWECFKDGWGYYVISGGSQVTMNVYVVKVDIKRNGVSIIGQNPTVAVGDKISLTGSVEPNGVSVFISSQDWTIEGNRIKNYIASTAEGRVENLTSSDLLNTSVNYYWVDGGEDREVKYFVNIASKAFGAFGYFDVKRPAAQCEIVIDSVRAYTDYPNGENIYLGLGNHLLGIKGIQFNRTGYQSNGTNGSTFWLQVINNTVNLIIEYDDTVISVNASNVVDPSITDYKYATTQNTEDSPHLGTHLLSKRMSANQNFSMRLMFQSNTANSIPVSLIRIDWNWSGDISRTGQNWSTTNPDSHNTPSAVDDSTLPTWTGHI